MSLQQECIKSFVKAIVSVVDKQHSITEYTVGDRQTTFHYGTLLCGHAKETDSYRVERICRDNLFGQIEITNLPIVTTVNSRGLNFLLQCLIHQSTRHLSCEKNQNFGRVKGPQLPPRRVHYVKQKEVDELTTKKIV